MGADRKDYVAELLSKGRGEPIAALLGLQLEELAPGYARVSMRMRPEFANFNGYVFGGIIMALADQAFAYAGNTLAHPSIATQFNVHFVAAAGLEDTLTAEGRVVKSGRRVGISEMTVTNQDGKLIARATGTTIPVEHP